MQNFTSIEQMMARYDVKRRPVTSFCPHCANPRGQGLRPEGWAHVRKRLWEDPLVYDCWRCLKCKKRFRKGDEVRGQSQGPEEWVKECIGLQYDTAIAMLSVNFPRPGGFANVIGGIAQIGMYSDDSTFARQSMVMTAQQQIANFQHHQGAQQGAQQIEAELQHVLALADDYFHGAERRKQAAAEEASARIAETQILGEAIADAMMRRVQEQKRST